MEHALRCWNIEVVPPSTIAPLDCSTLFGTKGHIYTQRNVQRSADVGQCAPCSLSLPLPHSVVR